MTLEYVDAGYVEFSFNIEKYNFLFRHIQLILILKKEGLIS